MVTIITPTRLSLDRSDYLLDAGHSLMKQNIPIEWIICADGDTPSKVQGIDYILTPFKSDNFDIKVIHTFEKVSGTAACRNFCLINATHEYVTSLDDDDMIPDLALSKGVEILEADRNAHWVSGLKQEFNNGKLSEIVEQKAIPGRYYPGQIRDMWENPQDPYPLNASGVIMRTKALTRIGGWPALPAREDLAMMMNMSNKYEGIIQDSVSYIYRLHSQQSSETVSYRRLENTVREAAWRFTR